MPQVAIRTGCIGPDGAEEVLTEYICDWPGCAKVATRVLGYVKELGLAAVVCDDHAPGTAGRAGHSNPR
jgi:hypothetical protein